MEEEIDTRTFESKEKDQNSGQSNNEDNTVPRSKLEELATEATIELLPPLTSRLQIQSNSNSYLLTSCNTSSGRQPFKVIGQIEKALAQVDLLQASKDSVQLLLHQLYKCHYQLLSYSAFYEDDECALLNLSALYLKSAKSSLQDAVNLQTYFTEQVGWLLTCNDISIEVRVDDNSLIEPFDQAIAIFSSLNSTLNQCSNQLRRAGNAESAKTILSKFSQKWSASEKSWRDWHCQISLASRNSAYHGLAWKLFDESFKRQL